MTKTISDLKNDYEKIANKYQLPSFQDLDDNFEIAKADKEGLTLLREIRKIMMDKIIGYVRFIELLINPAQAPMSFLTFTKQVSAEERKLLERVYQNFVQIELKALRREVDYSEKSEAELISDIFNVWNDSKKDILSIISFMERNWNSSTSKREKSYFG